MGQQSSSLIEPLSYLITPGRTLLDGLRKMTASPEEIAEATRIWRSLEHRSAKRKPEKVDLWECIALYRAAVTEMRAVCLARKLSSLRQNMPEEAALWWKLQVMAENCLRYAS